MLFEGCNGDVEIPSLQTEDRLGEEYVKVSNNNDLELLVKAMGWNSIEQFQQDTLIEDTELIGKFWFVCGNPSRVYY